MQGNVSPSLVIWGRKASRQGRCSAQGSFTEPPEGPPPAFTLIGLLIGVEEMKDLDGFPKALGIVSLLPSFSLSSAGCFSSLLPFIRLFLSPRFLLCLQPTSLKTSYSSLFLMASFVSRVFEELLFKQLKLL